MVKWFTMLVAGVLLAQTAGAQYRLNGVVSDSTQTPIQGVAIQLKDEKGGTVTDKDGTFMLNFEQPGQYTLICSHLQFHTKQYTLQITKPQTSIKLKLQAKVVVLKGVAVETPKEQNAVSSVTLQSVAISTMATPFNDISNILASLPSVMSNNELSTSYSVRGGNYDENIVRVNGIRVYRPFLVRSGQQEGLSFINADLIQSVNFSAGGWDATQGSKMSSLLQATYKEPTGWHGGLNLSLLGVNGYVTGKAGKADFLLGARHKRSRYILNTLDVNAAYDPRFTDVQSYWRLPVSKKISVSLLGAFAANNYRVVPQNGEISFGTFNQELRFEVGFEGQEQMKYNTWQGAAKLDAELTEQLSMNVIASYMRTFEAERSEVEGGYRLCDVDKNLDSDTFNECVQTRGIGTLYRYARNMLDAQIVDGEANAVLTINSMSRIDFGLRYSNRLILTNRNEYKFTDSIGYTAITEAQSANTNIDANELNTYAQYSYAGAQLKWTAGAFVSNNSLTRQWFINPRLLLTWAPTSHPRVSFKLGTGIYRQQPVYRELLTPTGELTNQPKTQSAWHIVLGNRYMFSWWGREFTMSTEAYYKALWDLVPYQFDNIRVVYYPQNNATGYATGFEARLAGEFIKGTESWFSVGLLSTKEQIAGVDAQPVRRPTDQRFKVGAVFEDHIPNDPSLRVNLSLQYGSGLPIGPPGSLKDRNLFTADAYTRVDISFSKLFEMKAPHWENIKLGVGIYNILGNKNAVTYTWIKDFSGQNFAVPNNLTGRLFNVTLATSF